VLVQSLSFSHNELYLASLGGQDDKRLVIWEVATGKGLCGNSAGTDVVNQVKFYNNSDDQLVTVRNFGANIWKVDYVNKKISPTEINLGSMKRQLTNVIIDPTDTVAYGCSKTGDILEISLEKALFKRVGPVKKLFSLGVVCIALLLNGDIIVGCGDGTVAKIGNKDMMIKAQAKVMGAVTSLTLTADGTYMFVGTNLVLFAIYSYSATFIGATLIS
jgi:cilia- and flagella-associated protein 52